MAQTIEENENNVRLVVEDKDSQELSEDKARALLIEKIRLEFESEKKTAHIKPQSEEEAQNIVMIERTKVIDKLYMKHGVKYADL